MRKTTMQHHEDLTREPGWPYSTMHFTPNPNPRKRRQETMKQSINLAAPWCVGALGGLYALWAVAYDPRTGPAGLSRMFVWATCGALVTTAVYVIAKVVARAR